MSNKKSNPYLLDGVEIPSAKDRREMFIGWAPAPKMDRRFLMAALPMALAGTTGISYTIARELGDPGAGARLTSATHEVTGAYSTDPYPMLRTLDPSAPGGVRTVLVVAEAKCTTALGRTPATAKPVKASGVLIQRKNRQMLEVPPLLDKWITDAPELTSDDLQTLRNPVMEDLGEVSLRGEIMDSKCFFGVMKPAKGITHKACASLCIRGGIPPSFWVRNGKGEEAVMLMTDADGGPMPLDILPLVADPVKVTGNIVRVGDILQLRADASAYERV